MALTVAPDFADGITTAAKLQQLSDAINERTPLYASVLTDQNVGPSNTTFQNVTELVLTVVANAVYEFRCYIQYSSNSTADIKVQFVLPSGATMDYIGIGFTSAEAVSFFRGTGGSATLGGSMNSFLFAGSVTTASTSGTVQMQAAQGTSTAVTTNVEVGSFIGLTRVA